MTTNLKLALTALAASGVTAAAVALPAIGDDSPGGDANCPKMVRPAGEPGKPGGPLKQSEGRGVGSGPNPAELRACLRSKGLNPPDDDYKLKDWIASQLDDSGAGKAESDTAVADKIKSCFVALDGAAPGKPDDKPATAKASRN
jgi:hypothetical protein